MIFFIFLPKSIIQIDEVPHYSTFSLRAKYLEKHIYYGIYAMFVELIDPETRLCAIDGTALRSSKYDSEAKIYNPFLILADSVEWFEIAYDLEFNLLTDINMRKAKRIESFTVKRYENALFIQSPIGLKLYKNRLKIEQLFSVLKGLYNLENPRLYG